MGILDDLLGELAGQARGGPSLGSPPQTRAGAGGTAGGTLAVLLPVLLALLRARSGGAEQAGAARGDGGLGDLLGQVLGGGAPAGGGGLGDLLEQLQRSGYREQADSWVGRGQNLPLPPDALEQIFGRRGLEQIARHTGISEGEASSGLSELLPEVVDHVTPEGRVPDLDSLARSVQDLSRRLGVR